MGALALKFFDHCFSGPSWAAWRVWVLALFVLPMNEAQATIYRQCTSRLSLPLRLAREAWLVVARRAGKSRMAAWLLAFFAGVVRWKLAPGEKGVALIVTPSRRQATVVLDYAEAFLKMIPGVEIIRRTQDTIEVSTGIVIQVQTASYRTPRGYTVVVCIVDEIAFLRNEETSANIDTEILRAVRPSLASVPGALLICLSSPYSQRGELFRMYEKHFGRDGSDVLVWQADTRTMNPTIPQALIDQAMEDDPASAAAEWGGQFRADLESLYAREALDQVVIRGRHELAPIPGVFYTAFTDPSGSGGGNADSFDVAIAHRDPAGLPVLDLHRSARPPFSPEAVAAEFARELKRYGVSKVTGDRYAGEWPREQFRKHGIEYQTSELTRSELYLELLPMVNSGSVELLDNARIIGQLAGLERRVGRSGKDSIDHRPGSHDDAANAAAGALVYALRSNEHATLPEAFRMCNRAASIAGFAAHTCYLLGGAFKPPGDEICMNCEGHLFVLASARAERDRTGAAVYFVEFYRHRITPNTYVALVAANRWADSMGL